jgi:hypothetical protein
VAEALCYEASRTCADVDVKRIRAAVEGLFDTGSVSVLAFSMEFGEADVEQTIRQLAQRETAATHLVRRLPPAPIAGSNGFGTEPHHGQMNHQLAHQATFHQHSQGLPYRTLY